MSIVKRDATVHVCFIMWIPVIKLTSLAPATNTLTH